MFGEIILSLTFSALPIIGVFLIVLFGVLRILKSLSNF